MSKTIPKEIINDMISKIVNQQQLSNIINKINNNDCLRIMNLEKKVMNLEKQLENKKNE